MYLIDTNVLSELTKPRPNLGVKNWVVDQPDMYVSVLTLGEIGRGAQALRKRDDRRAERIAAWLEGVRRDFMTRVLPIDERVIDSWVTLPTMRTLPTIDGLIAATAAAHDLTVVTRNTAEFSDLGVRLLNPFAD
ncbi:type II toxin-antitoxin system VapC family toxin [Leucobacter denitrificans]|uniref:Ribonuclease VapC n=1 Tax=Leucobacter denitrificans TaxID=683042 RepID=A0A7G9S2K1_9MICO|nr:type II toxin-antitoxin system VapC family toxin [Leucobacter denitrificans]QNN62076.1 type II toxin-antitoxin system VapC family toxin [Leucobacter denitrificans]